MVELSDEVYEKLKKDADDNKSLLSIVRTVCGLIFAVLVMITIVIPAYGIWLEARKTEVAMASARIEAINNRGIMEVEKNGLTNEEYFKWLEVRD